MHFVWIEDSRHEFQKAYPIPDAMLVLLAKDNAGVLATSSGEVNVVGVVSAESVAKAGSAGEMVGIAVAQEAKVADRHGRDTPPLQLRGNGDGKILIEIEADAWRDALIL